MKHILQDYIRNTYKIDQEVTLSRPDAKFGDSATNVALQLAKPLGKNPRTIAEELAEVLRQTGEYSEVSIAGPGFINVRFSDDFLWKKATRDLDAFRAGQEVVAEYSDPNPFKVLHAGHLYTTLVGDVIARLYEISGARVHRVNFGGDVGPHVARAMWGIIQCLNGEHSDALDTAVGDDLHDKAAWLAACYVEGNTAFDEDEQARKAILDYNQRIYALHADNDTTSDFARIYWTCRQWSYDYFDILYQDLQVSPFEKYYPESQTVEKGLQTVRSQQQKGVYTESDGAVVFEGEKYGLHTRVFINSQNLPTYETKDTGLILHKWEDYHFDESVIITANDIVEYMKVVQKAIEQYEPELVKRSKHITHGNLKLAGGKKMSSRKGSVLLALDILDAARDAQENAQGNRNEDVVLGAVKYAFLSSRIGSDIVYEAEKSVTLQGNSGPYLQYAHARACSILAKANGEMGESQLSLDEHERTLVVKLGEYADVVERAAHELLPHLICTYLYELAQSFNRFYEHAKIIGDEREAHRLAIVQRYRDTLADGLKILGIKAIERM